MNLKDAFRAQNTFLPKFELYVGERLAGEIVKEFTLLRPKFQLDCNGWTVEGDFSLQRRPFTRNQLP